MTDDNGLAPRESAMGPSVDAIDPASLDEIWTQLGTAARWLVFTLDELCWLSPSGVATRRLAQRWNIDFGAPSPVPMHQMCASLEARRLCTCQVSDGQIGDRSTSWQITERGRALAEAGRQQVHHRNERAAARRRSINADRRRAGDPVDLTALFAPDRDRFLALVWMLFEAGVSDDRLGRLFGRSSGWAPRVRALYRARIRQRIVSASLAAFRPDNDDQLLARLRRAGAILSPPAGPPLADPPLAGPSRKEGLRPGSSIGRLDQALREALPAATDAPDEDRPAAAPVEVEVGME